MTIEAYFVKTPFPLLGLLKLYIPSSNYDSFTSTVHDLINRATLSSENHTQDLNNIRDHLTMWYGIMMWYHDTESWDGINVKSHVQTLIPSHDTISWYDIAWPNAY